MYGHPYDPYDVQIDFMNSLYKTLGLKKVGIFESPTGTGKTLSLLCPSVSWLRDESQRQLEAQLAEIDASGGPNWMIESAKEAKRSQMVTREEALSKLVETARLKLRQKPLKPQIKRFKRSENSAKPSLQDFLLEEPSSVQLALAGYTDVNISDSDEQLQALETTTKIFFTSRTHSQLSQVADALSSLKIKQPPRFIPLGSRRQLCIHKDVTKLGTIDQMNEKCADLQKNNCCSFRHQTTELRNQSLGQIMDIEDLAEAGKKIGACPYYASREAVKYAEVVALPYPMLLMESNREALGLDLNNSVVIIDEAHNLIDTLTSLHSATLTARVVSKALLGLEAYVQRLGQRLSFTNRRKVLQIVKLATSLKSYFDNKSKEKPGKQVNVMELFAKGNVDTLDFQELNEFVQNSKLVFKVDSYIQALQEERTAQQMNGQEKENPVRKSSSKLANDQVDQKKEPRVTSSLGTLMRFVLIVSDPLSDGKLFHDITEEHGHQVIALRYLVLDAAPSFQSILDTSKTVVLAGGTMEPTTDFTHHLLPDVSKDQILQSSYGHIVPRSQLLVMPVGNLKITFTNRNDPKVIAQLGRLFCEITKETPAGVVAFFPGYAFLLQVVKAWQQTSVWDELLNYKRIFYETSGMRNGDDTFAQFSKEATNPKSKGALLLAVVGGKLSEGINFSDDLARGVIMVGLPFPNAFSAEMVAKRQYIEKISLQQNQSRDQAKENAKLYYENLAMRAVNQSVGRSIRHIRDYAAIFLIDERYRSPAVQSKLSKWVRDNIKNESEESVTTQSRQFWALNRPI